MRRELEELAVTYLVLLDCWNQSISIRYAASGSNAHGVENWNFTLKRGKIQRRDILRIHLEIWWRESLRR
jgi:hypothetical protein